MKIFFTKHLDEVNESYFLHFRNAISFSLKAFLAFIVLFIHAILPFLFTKTGSNVIFRLYDKMLIRIRIVNSRCKNKKIAIIGFGASGIIKFYNLIKNQDNINIDIFDRNFMSQGVAYDTSNFEHLLNVRAKNMSALASDRDHFVNWLRNNNWKYEKNDFVPRSIYGLYLKSIVKESLSIADKKNITVKFNNIDIESIDMLNDCFVLNKEIYNKCYLCIGVELLQKDKNFWHLSKEDITRYLSRDIIHIVGTGLSSFDAVLEIMGFGFKGRIIMHSKSGKLSEFHEDLLVSENEMQFTVKNFTIHKFIKLCKNSRDWRYIVDSIRPITNDIWQSFSVQKKKSFISHLFKYWNKYRHRSPKIQHEKIMSLIDQGRVEITTSPFPEDSIYCLGQDFSNTSPLEFSLIKNKIVQRSELGIGITSLKSNFVIVGAKNFGRLFETTAIPEIREQAQ